jgi:signal transduction histidine kinase
MTTTRRKIIIGTMAVTSSATSAAVAAPLDADGHLGPFFQGLATMSLTLLALAALFFLLWRIFQRSWQHHISVAELRRTLSMLNQCFVAWLPDGEMMVSPSLQRTLGLRRPVSSLADLFDAGGSRGFAHGDFAKLEEAAATMFAGAETLRPFNVQGAGKHFLVRTDWMELNTQQVALLWFEDVSEVWQDLVKRDREIAILSERNRMLAAALNALHVPVWVRGPDLQLVWVNAAYAQVVEAANPTAAVTSGVELLAGPRAGDANIEAAKTARDSGKQLAQRHYVVVDGQRRAMAVHNVPSGDRHAVVVGYAIDATAEEDVRNELTRHRKAYAETLNKLSTAVAIFAADRSLDFYNDAFVRLWKMPEGWLNGNPDYGELLEALRTARRLPEQVDFATWKRNHVALHSDLVEPLEEMWHLPDDTTLRVVTQPHPMGGLLILFEDVTDRLALERSYNTLIAVQRATLNNLHEGVAVFGSDGALALSNTAFANIWGWQAADNDVAAPKHLSDKAHLSDMVSHAEKRLADAVEYDKFRQLVFNDETERVVHGAILSFTDGRVVNGSAVPLPDGATLLTFLDITDSTRIERALRERAEALETADRLKTEFVAHMSYELRTPLNNVIGFAELLDKEYYGPLNAQQHTYTRNILDSSSHLLTLINDILDLAVIEAGGMTLSMTPVKVETLLQGVANMVREEIATRQQRLEISLPNPMPDITCDERRLRQVLYNLVSNAMKFTPEQGRITLAAEDLGGTVRLSVSDTGVGMDIDEQSRAFDRFHRGKNAPQGQGVGLGLSLVQSIVDLHGGTVSITSEPKRGTRVDVILPRERAS